MAVAGSTAAVASTGVADSITTNTTLALLASRFPRRASHSEDIVGVAALLRGRGSAA
jgi:hypothetical protein